MSNHILESRRYVIGGIAFIIVAIYIVRLAFLQLMSGDYKAHAESNAFYNKVLYPSRGIIYDRNGKVMVYNQPAYDIMVVTRELRGLDTLDFCRTVGMTRKEFEERLNNIKDRRKNPGYSSYTHQLFIGDRKSVV